MDVAHKTLNNVELCVGALAKFDGRESQSSLCKEVCGLGFYEQSCGEAVLVPVYSTDAPQNFDHI